MIIDDSAALARFCDALQSAPYIAVDTEFVRERTYYAQLCLVQVAYGEHAAAIDTLAPGLDLRPLRDLLLNRAILKVFHACSQDLEILLQKTGEVPGPVFDTQIAASACGIGEQPGYATLVENLLGIRLDKASQATDWSVRPLSTRQVTYAIGDVTHLCKVYERLVAELERTGRGAWVAGEMKALLNPDRYQTDPREAYKAIKIRGADRRTLGLLRELADWRERTAMTRDLPRRWVLPDDAMAEIAQHAPEDEASLAKVRALKSGFARGPDGKTLLELVQYALSLPESELPVRPPRKATVDSNEALVALFQTLLRLRCDEHGVAMKMVASREDLDLLATQENPEIPAMSGWRRKVFGEDALKLRDGKLALSARAGAVVVSEVG